MREESYALFRHTVDAPQVATVGHGKTQVVDGPVVVIQHVSPMVQIDSSSVTARFGVEMPDNKQPAFGSERPKIQ